MEGRKEFVPQNLELIEINEEERLTKRAAMERKLANILSPAKISAYVEQCLDGRDSMLASEILKDREDHTDLERFIRLIYIRLYGQRKRMSYSVTPQSEVEAKGYRFRDFVIARR